MGKSFKSKAEDSQMAVARAPKKTRSGKSGWQAWKKNKQNEVLMLPKKRLVRKSTISEIRPGKKNAGVQTEETLIKAPTEAELLASGMKTPPDRVRRSRSPKSPPLMAQFRWANQKSVCIVFSKAYLSLSWIGLQLWGQHHLGRFAFHLCQRGGDHN